MPLKLKIRIRTKLAFTYLLVVAVILLIINSQVIRTLENNYLEEEAAKTLANANIIALAGQNILLRGDPHSLILSVPIVSRWRPGSW